MPERRKANSKSQAVPLIQRNMSGRMAWRRTSSGAASAAPGAEAADAAAGAGASAARAAAASAASAAGVACAAAPRAPARAGLERVGQGWCSHTRQGAMGTAKQWARPRPAALWKHRSPQQVPALHTHTPVGCSCPVFGISSVPGGVLPHALGKPRPCGVRSSSFTTQQPASRRVLIKKPARINTRWVLEPQRVGAARRAGPYVS